MPVLIRFRVGVVSPREACGVLSPGTSSPWTTTNATGVLRKTWVVFATRMINTDIPQSTSPSVPVLVASSCPTVETTDHVVLVTRSSFCDVFRGDEADLYNHKMRWSIFWDGWSLFWDKNQHFGTDGQNYGTDGQYFGITCTKTYLKFWFHNSDKLMNISAQTKILISTKQQFGHVRWVFQSALVHSFRITSYWPISVSHILSLRG